MSVFFEDTNQPGIFSTVQMRQSEIVVNKREVHYNTPPLSEEDYVRNDQTIFEEKLLRENEELKQKIEELTKRVKDFEKGNIKVVGLTADVSPDTVSVHSDD